MVSSVEASRVESAVRGADQGDLSALNALAGGVDVLARAAAHFYTGSPSPPAEQMERAQEGSPADRRRAAWACAYLARAAAAALDPDGVERWHDLARKLGIDGDPELEMPLLASSLWARLGRGEDPLAVDAAARRLHVAASGASMAAVVIEAAALRAMAALAAGNLESAISSARRASRMGRTEALPAPEWLANLVLARVRRHAGRPHIATRILGALAKMAAPAWHGWLSWELLLAGGPARLATTMPEGLGEGRAARGAACGIALLEAAARGDAGAFGARGQALQRELVACAPLWTEAEILLAALDPARAAPAELAPWRRGETELLPIGLHGLFDPSGEEGPSPNHVTACVVARPGGPALRALRIGAALIHDARMIDETMGGARGSSRTDAGLAVLALAGSRGVHCEPFFRSTYGFAFSEPLHKGVLDVLLHRVRKRLGLSGQVTREGDRIELTLHEAVIIPDTRCTLPTVERVLRALANRGEASAQDLADELGLQVRTVQIALSELQADGACVSRRAARQVKYRVDDTTFAEPSRIRRVAP
jgi:DNA-binding transcriptional ArsR family regulator